MSAIAFRFNISKKEGFGHFSRCTAIAQQLNNIYKFKIHFIVNKNIPQALLKNFKNISIISLNNKKNLSEEKNIYNQILNKKIKILFFDIKKNYRTIFLKKIKKNGTKLITIDDKFNKRNYCDICFYPPIPQFKKLKWKYKKTKKYVGWKYIPIKIDYTSKLKKYKKNNKILIIGGGSNYNNFISKILKRLNMFQEKLDIIIPEGYGYNNNFSTIKNISSSKHNISLLSKKLPMVKIMLKSQIIIMPYGMSCFESMLLKKNSIILTRNKDDYQSASIFKKKEVCIVLKKISDLNERLFRKFMSSKKNINNVSKISSYLRRGSFNIAKIINETK